LRAERPRQDDRTQSFLVKISAVPRRRRSVNLPVKHPAERLAICSRVAAYTLAFLAAASTGWASESGSRSLPIADTASFGSVVGRATQEGGPAAFANVVVLGTRIGTMTRDDGSFRLDGVPVGPRVLQLQGIGCNKASLSVEEPAAGFTHQHSSRPIPFASAMGWSFRPEFSAAERDSFPNAREWWDGGCVIEHWSLTEVAFCSDCRQAHERWLQRTGRRR